MMHLRLGGSPIFWCQALVLGLSFQMRGRPCAARSASPCQAAPLPVQLHMPGGMHVGFRQA
eukprot:10534513-Karenia_brevis.AAC.1